MLGINLAFLKLLARFQPFMYRKHTVFLCLSPFLQILPIPGKIVYAEDLPCLVCWSEEGQEDETNLFLQQSCACGRESNAIQLSFLIPHIYIHICIYMNMSIYLRYDCSNQQCLQQRKNSFQICSLTYINWVCQMLNMGLFAKHWLYQSVVTSPYNNYNYNNKGRGRVLWDYVILIPCKGV